jgi:hypothetical protein
LQDEMPLPAMNGLKYYCDRQVWSRLLLATKQNGTYLPE